MPGSTSFILSGPENDFRLPNEPIGKYFCDCLKSRNPNEVVNVDAVTGDVLTCGKLLEDTIKLCAILKNLDIKKGDVIAIVSKNSINYCVPVFAALLLGVTVNTLNPAYSPRELQHGLLISKAKLLFCSEDALKNVLKVQQDLDFVKTIVLMGSQAENHCYIENLENLMKTVTADTESFQPEIFDSSEEGAFVFLSSGTTGLSKGVLITHQNFKAALSIFRQPRYGNLTSQDTTVLALPFFHVFGMLIQTVAIVSATKVILMDKFKPDLFLALVEKHKATKLFLVPPLLLFLTRSPLVDNYDISSVKDIMFGAAPVGEELRNEAEKKFTGVTLRQLYGLTESSGACTFEAVDSSNSRSVGVLVPDILAKVWDQDRNENLGPLKSGELCFKGEMIMKKYLGDANSTHHCIDKDGFLHTGDLGYYDENGHFYIVDRIKEMIKYKGFQVPPAELEALLLTHPEVSDCGVIGIPDERAGQVPLAYIVRKNDANVTEQQLQDYVADRISIQKRLYGGAVFVEEIPKNPSGKILRRKLLDIFKASKQR